MKIHNIFACLILSVACICLPKQKLLGQCDDFDPATFTHTTAIWDWRDNSAANWEAFVKISETSYGSTTLAFPFQPQGANQYPNVAHLNTIEPFDYEPSDGWELVYRAFGANSIQEAIEDPVFVLYNRFSATLRVFIWTSFNNALLNESAVVVEFDNNMGKVSALLSLVENPTHSIDNFTKANKSITPNEWNNTSGGEWLFADIPMAYDPCTCADGINGVGGTLTENLSELKIYGKLIQNITLTAKTVLAGDQPVTSSGNKGTNASGFGTQVKNATEFYKKSNALITALGAFSTGNSKGSNEANKEKAKDLKKETTKFALPPVFKALPVIGEYLTFVDALITGGKKNSTASTAQTVALTNTKFEGELQLAGNVLPVQFYTPGTDYPSAPQGDPNKMPVYDHVLGIFNLMEVPVIEYASYQIAGNLTDYDCVNTAGQSIGYTFPKVNQYHLKESIKFAINPASELELVDLKASIIYQLGENKGEFAVDTAHNIGNVNGRLALYGPTTYQRILGNDYTGTSYVNRLKNSGINIEVWPKANINNANSKGVNDIGKIVYGTEMLSMACLDKQSILLAIPDSNELKFGDYHYEPTFRLKVRAILKRTDAEADDDTDNVIFIATYAVKMEEKAGGLTYNVTWLGASDDTPQGCWQNSPRYIRDYGVNWFSSTTGNAVFPMGTNGLPYDRVFTNQTIHSDWEAINSITVDGGSISPNQWNPEVTFTAGQEINILNDVDISPGVNLDIGLPSVFQGCESAPLPQAMDWPSIKAICEDGSKYKPYVTREAAEPIEEVFEDWTINFTSRPNPFQESTIIEYELSEAADISMAVYDVLGREVKRLLTDSHVEAGKHQIRLNGGELEAGLYHVVITKGEFRKSLKVVKTN